jgi:hypothetical protein
MITEYVSGRTKRAVTAASALNELRVALEAVSSRVSGEKPRDDYKPRTRSRAGKEFPEDMVADAGDGTKIDAVQLVQELAVILAEIARAPSARAEAEPPATVGGNDDPELELSPVDALATEGSTGNAPHSPPAMIGPGRDAYQNATFGGGDGRGGETNVEPDLEENHVRIIHVPEP